MRKIENLVFEGGGVLGMAYAGAITVLEEGKVLQDVKRVAGTSAGALVAGLVSLGYSANEIKAIVNKTDFKKFEDHKDPFRIPFKYGLYKGNFLLSYIQGFFKDKLGNESATFADLKKAGGKDLKVYACNLTKTQVQEFSFDKTPNVIVAESIRASMSIPLFFSAWQFPNGVPNNDIYVDGGTIYNYPINAFDDYSKTLGFFFQEAEPSEHEEFHYNHIIKYIELLFKALLNSQKIVFHRNKEELAITVLIDSVGVSPTNFKLSDKDKTALFESGKKATLEYLASNKDGSDDIFHQSY